MNAHCHKTSVQTNQNEIIKIRYILTSMFNKQFFSEGVQWFCAGCGGGTSDAQMQQWEKIECELAWMFVCLVNLRNHFSPSVSQIDNISKYLCAETFCLDVFVQEISMIWKLEASCIYPLNMEKNEEGKVLCLWLWHTALPWGAGGKQTAMYESICPDFKQQLGQPHCFKRRQWAWVSNGACGTSLRAQRETVRGRVSLVNILAYSSICKAA